MKEKDIRLTLFLLILLINASLLAAAQPALASETQLESISNPFFQGDFDQVISQYPKLPQQLREQPLACFWVGQSYLREHDIQHAEEFLRKASEGGLVSPQRERAQRALERIAVIKQLCPPFYRDYSLDGYTIRIFAKPSAWIDSIAAQMPIFLQRAKEAFGNKSPYVAFYLFENRVDYGRFFEAHTSTASNSSDHRGTGVRHMVLFCRYFPNGTEIGSKNKSDLYFRVLHEYGHSLFNTVYGDQFKMPAYLNEGMADYFGWRFYPDGSKDAEMRLRKQGLTKRALTYDELSTRSSADGETLYAFGDVMVSQFMQNKPLSVYQQIIDGAKTSGGNFEYAIQQATGRNPKELYPQIIRTFWKN